MAMAGAAKANGIKLSKNKSLSMSVVPIQP